MRRLACISSIILSVLTAVPAYPRVIEERVYLVPARESEQKIVRKIKDRLPAALPMTAGAEIEPPFAIPQSAYDASRKQYSAQAVIDGAQDRLRLALTDERAVIVTGEDLYAPGMDFVSGLADKAKGTCVVSLARLKNEFYGLAPDERVFTSRAMKEVVHELGHSWGLEHCPNIRCVMFSSGSLAETDKKRETFCYKCGCVLTSRSGTVLGDKINKVRDKL